MKRFANITILTLFLLATLYLPNQTTKATPDIDIDSYPATTQGFPLGINYTPEGVIMWSLEESTGHEKVNIKRLSDNDFECEVQDVKVAPSLKKNYPVRLYEINEALLEKEQVPLDLPFHELVEMGVYVEPESKVASVSAKSLDLTKETKATVQIQSTDKRYVIAFGETIVYSGVDDRITVTGGTEGSPYDFQDIYDEDMANGWGQVSKQGNSQFYFECGLDIGDGSTETWFQDTEKQVAFWDGGNIRYIEVFDNANFILGSLIDATDKITKDGCQLTYKGSSYAIYSKKGGIVYLYSTSIHAYDVGMQVLYADRVWNCLTSRCAMALKGDIEKYISSQSRLKPYGAGTYNNILVENDGSLIYLSHALGATISNLVGTTTSTYSFYVIHVSGETFYLVDTDLNKWTFKLRNTYDGCKIYRQYTVDIKVTDEKGNAIEGASVTLTDKDDTEVFSVSTAADGTITRQTMTYKLYTGNESESKMDETTYSPHTLTVTADNFFFVRVIDDLDKKIDWVIGGENMEGIVLELSSFNTFIGSTVLGLLALIVIAILSALAYFRPTAVIFIVIFALSWAFGLSAPDIISSAKTTSSFDITVAIACIAYGLMCAGWAFRLMFWRSETREGE